MQVHTKGYKITIIIIINIIIIKNKITNIKAVYDINSTE